MKYSREQVIDGFRRLANLIEQNPEMNLPYEGSSDESAMLFMCHNKESFAATVKAFGHGQKADGGDTMDFIPDFPLNIKIFGFKSSICERRPVTRMVEAQPELHIPARVEPAIPAHEETVIEYACSPFLEAL